MKADIDVANEYEEFRKISYLIGSDIALTQGAGGNTSIKVAPDLMKVKASGKWLSSSLEEDIFVAVDWAAINDNVANGSPDLLRGAFVEDGSGLRPSIETTLHSLMPHRIVCHTHSVRVIAHAVWDNSTSLLEARLKGLNWAFIPYSKPGEPLAELVHGELRLGRKDVLVIQNHGLVVGGETAEECYRLMRSVEARLRCGIRPVDGLDRFTGLPPDGVGESGYQLLEDEHAIGLACCPDAIEFATGGSLYPDHVVFLGSGMLYAGDCEAAISGLEKAGAAADPLAPKSAIVAQRGVLCSHMLGTAGREMVKAVAQVVLLDPDGDGIRYLTRDHELELVNWDAERFRQGQ